MKPLIVFLTVLALAALACGFGTPTPTLDMHVVETIAAGTLTAIAPAQPTQAPPTLIPVPTLTLVPTATAVPTNSPVPPPPPSGSGPIRITFPPGGISATVTNTVTFPNRVEYVLRAMKNQKMTVSISSPGDAANFSIVGVTDGQPLKRLENEDRTWSGILPANQDYLISVAVPGGSANFTLTVTVVWP